MDYYKRGFLNGKSLLMLDDGKVAFWEEVEHAQGDRNLLDENWNSWSEFAQINEYLDGLDAAYRQHLETTVVAEEFGDNYIEWLEMLDAASPTRCAFCTNPRIRWCRHCARGVCKKHWWSTGLCFQCDKLRKGVAVAD